MITYKMSKESQVKYSLSQSEKWAEQTMNPNIIEFVDRVNTGVQTQGVERWQKDLELIMSAMRGDQGAMEKLIVRSGGRALPIVE